MGMSIIIERIPDGISVEQVLTDIREYTNHPIAARIVNSNAVISFRSVELATQFALDHASVRIGGHELGCFFNDEEITDHESRKHSRPYSQPRTQISTGVEDMGNDLTPFVLLRNVVSKAQGALSELNGKDIWPRRMLQVRNRLTNAIMPFCFLEFGSPLEALKAIESIGAKKNPVGTPSSIHFGVFRPSGRLEPQFVSSSGVGMVYWDSEYVVTQVKGNPQPADPLPDAESKLPSSSDVQPKKKRRVVKKMQLPTRPQKPLEIDNFESFSDLERLSCYLCRRKFTTPIALGDHERYSELHQENLQTLDKLELARKISDALNSKDSEDR